MTRASGSESKSVICFPGLSVLHLLDLSCLQPRVRTNTRFMNALLLTKALRLPTAFVIWFVSITAANATSISFPKFSQPTLQNDRLIFTSPDSKRLLCIKLTGEKAWENTYVRPIDLIVGPDSQTLVQVDRVVSAVSP